MDISTITDEKLLDEIGRRFHEKKSSIGEMEEMTKKLLVLNEKNKKSQEIKSKFLSLVKNEFNNPMSSLLNLVNMMVKKSDDPRLSELSSLMKMELLKLDFSLKNIFCASEIEAGEIANDYSMVKIKDIFDEVTNYFSFLINEKSLEINYTSEGSDEIISDSQKVNIILLNLVSNACEYSYSNSKIDVTFASDDDNYIISVEDMGEGIEEGKEQDIYSSFYHYESGNTRRTAGLGLGLSVVSGLIESLDGSIENTRQENKTVFTIKIAKVDEKDVSLSRGIGSNEFIFDDSEDMVEF
ncbi:MAG: sensor histidine kinase [Sulfurimonas sp.]|nr:sensor histidine kinase [Sulfurimonas sp.]